MDLEEELEDIAVGGLGGVEDELYRLGMPTRWSPPKGTSGHSADQADDLMAAFQPVTNL